MQPNRDGGAGRSGKKQNHREHGGHGEKQTTEGTEDTEKKKHNAREPQLNGDGGWGLAGNSLAWRHENLRARGRYQGLVVQRRQTTEDTEKENHRGHRGHGENKTQR